MFVRLGSFFAMVLVAALALTSCGKPDDKVEPTVTRIPNAANAPVIVTGTAGSSAPAQQAASSNAPMTLEIQLEDIKFDKDSLTVPANTQVTINIKNSGAATHNFNIDALNVHSGDIAGGGTGSVSFNSGPAGTLEYYCNIPGHKEAGMDGKLTVSANAESAPAAGGSPVAAAQPTQGAAQAPAPQTTFDVQLKDIAFDITSLEVPANSDITINLKNAGAATHNFNIDDLDVHSGDIAGGGTGVVKFNSGAPGTHQYYCNIPGHKEAGMVGTLTVSAGGGGASAEPTQAAAAPTQAAAPAPAAPTTFDVQLKDIAFDVTSLEVPVNSDITINLKNIGAATHNFNIDDLNVHSGDIAAGATAVVKFNSGPAGTHQYYCNIPGHKEAGMVGTLTVSTSGGSATAPIAATPPVAAASPSVPAATAPAAAQTTFEIDMKDIAFSVKSLDVPANTDITINLVNNGAATHNFNIDSLNVHSGDFVAGQKGSVTFNSGPSGGSLQYYCNIPGHKEAGMLGTINVK